MLMRPIERPLFQQTRDWLHSDPENELIIVLDEAHMYRGAGGAEVALLLRRLFSRLDIPRERIRFILTSASLGSGEDALRAVEQFGRDLTGLATGSPRAMCIVTGTRETRAGANAGSAAEASALAQFDLQAFERHDGFQCESIAAVQGVPVPLLVERDGRRVVVGVQSGLLDAGWGGHSLRRLIEGRFVEGLILNDFVLGRNLPDEHHLVRDAFG